MDIDEIAVRLLCASIANGEASLDGTPDGHAPYVRQAFAVAAVFVDESKKWHAQAAQRATAERHRRTT